MYHCSRKVKRQARACAALTKQARRSSDAASIYHNLKSRQSVTAYDPWPGTRREPVLRQNQQSESLCSAMWKGDVLTWLAGTLLFWTLLFGTAWFTLPLFTLPLFTLTLLLFALAFCCCCCCWLPLPLLAYC